MGFAEELDSTVVGPAGRACRIGRIAEALGADDGPVFLAAIADPAVSTGKIRLALARRLDPARHDDAADLAARLEPLDLGTESTPSGVMVLRSSRSLTRHRSGRCRCAA